MALDSPNPASPAPRRPTIGWREWLNLPQFAVPAIKAKIDTGARSSSLHAFDLTVSTAADGTEWVRFTLHPFQRTEDHAIVVEAPVACWRPIRSSNGSSELRPIIRTAFVIGEQSYEIDLSLSNRDAMGFRMLLGREALRGRFVVEPGRSYLFGRRSRYPDGRTPRVKKRDKK